MNVIYYLTLVFIFLLLTAVSNSQQDIWEQAGNFSTGRVWTMHTDEYDRVYASSSRLLYRSTDFGDSWELIGDFTTWGTDIYDIEINSKRDIFLASSNSVAVFRSVDDRRSNRKTHVFRCRSGDRIPGA